MDTAHSNLADYTRRSIDIAARALIRTGVFSRQDLDDVRADITLYTLRQLPRHDGGKAKPKTFISMVVTDGSKHVLRDHFAEKRQCQRAALSLDADSAPDEDDNDVALQHVLDADDVAITMGYRRRPAHEQAVMSLDVNSVLSGLPRNLRDCCAAIMDGRSVSDVARESGMPRSTFRDQVMVPIRQAFEAAGLDAWL